ncbi:hypothetical protein CRYUN_Cryun37aG0107400 [Craigia yunnanensis]
MCGRRLIEEGEPLLVDWVWQLMMQWELLAVVDARLKANGGFDEEEVEKGDPPQLLMGLEYWRGSAFAVKTHYHRSCLYPTATYHIGIPLQGNDALE